MKRCSQESFGKMKSTSNDDIGNKSNIHHFKFERFYKYHGCMDNLLCAFERNKTVHLVFKSYTKVSEGTLGTHREIYLYDHKLEICFITVNGVVNCGIISLPSRAKEVIKFTTFQMKII